MKTSPRRVAREFALQGLYQWQLTDASATEVLAHLKELDGYASADAKLLRAALTGTIKEAATLRSHLEPLADRKWDEVSPVERSILLLAAWELLLCPDTPYRVAINEAIELAKGYGGTDGHKYVNGILDKLAPVLRPGEVGIAGVAPKRKKSTA